MKNIFLSLALLGSAAAFAQAPSGAPTIFERMKGGIQRAQIRAGMKAALESPEEARMVISERIEALRDKLQQLVPPEQQAALRKKANEVITKIQKLKPEEIKEKVSMFADRVRGAIASLSDQEKESIRQGIDRVMSRVLELEKEEK